MEKKYEEKNEGVRRWEEFVKRNEDVFKQIAKGLDKKKPAKKK